MEKLNLDKLDFLEFDFEEDEENKQMDGFYKLIIADDDKEVHSITEMTLKSFNFEGKELQIIHTYSGEETLKAMEEHQDTAILLLDVVMEETHSGLKVVDYLRNKLNNQMTRIILRTGQPGEAPKESVIREYEINDYLLKTELTIQKLYAALLTGLRSYRDLIELEKHKKGLEKIIETSANLFNHSSIDDFLNSILSEISHFYKNESHVLYIAEDRDVHNGFISIERQNKKSIVAATGKYEEFIGKNIENIPELEFMIDWIGNKTKENIKFIENGFLIKSGKESKFNNYIFIEGNNEEYDFNLINLFLQNYSLALDNYILNNMISNTQQEMIFALGEVIESNFENKSDHVRRVASMMHEFSLLNGFSYAESEIVKVASMMHDIGKFKIREEILSKPGELTDSEYEVVKKHSKVGHSILSKSNADILQVAAEMALNHHERYDGPGYPFGLKGKLIPLSARMLSIVDMYDASTHNKIYKDAITTDEAIKYLIDNKGTQFDSKLVELFVENIEKITQYNSQ